MSGAGLTSTYNGRSFSVRANVRDGWKRETLFGGAIPKEVRHLREYDGFRGADTHKIGSDQASDEEAVLPRKGERVLLARFALRSQKE